MEAYPRGKWDISFEKSGLHFSLINSWNNEEYDSIYEKFQKMIDIL